MNVWKRILFGLAAGAVTGYVVGRWGASGGMAAMIAGVVSAALLPLVVEWSRKRQAANRLEDK